MSLYFIHCPPAASLVAVNIPLSSVSIGEEIRSGTPVAVMSKN